MKENDYDLGDLVKFSRTASSDIKNRVKNEVEEVVFLIVEKKRPLFFEKVKHPFYYIFSPNEGRIGPCFHHELLKIND